jgi:hypothetical protein
MSTKKIQNCADCVNANNAGLCVGTHAKKSVNHPHCGCCSWALCVTGNDEKRTVVQYISER